MSGNKARRGRGLPRSHIEMEAFLPFPLSYHPDLILPVLLVGTLSSQLDMFHIQSPLQILLKTLRTSFSWVFLDICSLTQSPTVSRLPLFTLRGWQLLQSLTSSCWGDFKILMPGSILWESDAWDLERGSLVHFGGVIFVCKNWCFYWKSSMCMWLNISNIVGKSAHWKISVFLA